MAILVKANNFIETDIYVKNIGQIAGTFKVSARAVFHGASITEQMFFNAKGYSSSNPAPAGAQYVTSGIVPPNAVVQIKMYSDKWLNWTNGQMFDVIFTIKVLETNISYVFTGVNMLQHTI